MTCMDPRRRAVLPLLLALALAGCAGSSPPTPAPGTAAKAPPSASRLLRSATVSGIYDGRTVALHDGVYEGAPYAAGGAARPTVTLIERMTASGELDGQPGEEVVALLAESSGASGERIYLAVFERKDDTLTNLGTAEVGDRVKLRRLTVEGASIVLDVVQTGPKEPMCCGTQLARKTYKLESGQLRQVASQTVGRLSLATISRLEWVLEEMNGKPVVQGSQPATFTVQGDTASGFGGCNSFSGAIKETSPGKISLGDLAATMMACADAQMLLEDQYLRRLRQVDSYTFLAGRLALSWEGSGERGLLVFRRR
jgi:heat shock protein HslJ